jgi:hypothetical protein
MLHPLVDGKNVFIIINILKNTTYVIGILSQHLFPCVWQGSASVPILVPLSSSDHHVELDMRYQSKNARYALTALANEIPNKHKTAAIAPRKNFKGILTSFDVLFFEILFLLGSP